MIWWGVRCADLEWFLGALAMSLLTIAFIEEDLAICC